MGGDNEDATYMVGENILGAEEPNTMAFEAEDDFSLDHANLGDLDDDSDLDDISLVNDRGEGSGIIVPPDLEEQGYDEEILSEIQGFEELALENQDEFPELEQMQSDSTLAEYSNSDEEMEQSMGYTAPKETLSAEPSPPTKNNRSLQETFVMSSGDRFDDDDDEEDYFPGYEDNQFSDTSMDEVEARMAEVEEENADIGINEGEEDRSQSLDSDSFLDEFDVFSDSSLNSIPSFEMGDDDSNLSDSELFNTSASAIADDLDFDTDVSAIGDTKKCSPWARWALKI